MRNKPITKALIPVAGYGTRFLPITKTLNKSMLPIMNRPVVDYIVEDCVKAGIKDIYFVILPTDNQLRDYYSQNVNLEDYLIDRNATDKLALIKDVHKQAKFHFLEQPQDGRYGTAIPPLLMQKELEQEEPFLVLMGDDFMYKTDGSSAIKNLIETYSKSGASCLVTAVEIAASEAVRYGVMQIDGVEDGLPLLKTIIEKPRNITSDTALINISKYVFTPDIFAHLNTVKPNAENKEYYINDALMHLVNSGAKCVVHMATGQFLDAGTVQGFIRANLIVAKSKGIDVN
jgi:UTP--glucose-1-phosphate uridylyltransferase